MRNIRPLSVAGAVVATLAVWLVAVPLAGVDLTARTGSGTTTVGPVPIVLATVLAGLAGWGLLAVLERRSSRPAAVWTTVAVAVLALSMLGPLGGVTLGAKLTLAALHLAAGAVLILGLRHTTRPAR